MNVWGIDISNWNGEVTPQNLIDWKAAGVSVCMIRASRESPALAAIAKQQFTVTKPVVQTTLPYGWCYGNDVPEKMVQETINLCDGLTTEKKLVFDVEDITNFIAEFGKFRPSLALPKRYQATISAMQGGLHIGFSSLLPTVAVSWLQSAFIEANKLGYEPCIYCVSPDTRVLTTDLRWIEAGDLSVGVNILAFEEEHIPGRPRHHIPATITGYERRMSPMYEIELEDGSILHATGEHKWLVTQANGGRGKPVRWMTTERMANTRSSVLHLAKFIEPWEDGQDDYVSGFLAAAFDGEGCLQLRPKGGGGPVLGFAQKPNSMLQSVVSFLNQKGFSVDNLSLTVSKSGVVNLRLPTREVLRFMGQMRPPRLMDIWETVNICGLGKDLRATKFVGVQSVRYVGEREIAAISSSSSTYFAEGFGAHNSAAWCWNPLTGSSTAFSKAKWLVAQFDQIANLTIFDPVGGVQALMGKQYSDTGTIPFNDPNSPSYDFSIWDPTMLMSTPVVTTGGPDIPDAQDRLNTLDQMIDSDAATLHTWIDGVRQDLRSLGAAK